MADRYKASHRNSVISTKTRMKMKQFIVLLTVIAIVASQRKRFDYGSLRDDLQTGSFYAQELTAGLESGDILQSTQNFFGLISQIHPVVGAVAGAVYFCLSVFGVTQQTEDPLLVAIREGVTVIWRKLDGLSEAIKNLEYALKFEIRGLSLQDHADDIEGLLFLQERLLGSPDNVSRDEFTKSCFLSRIHEKPFWFANILTAQNPSNLKHLILEQRDGYQLHAFYQRVISLLFQAVILSSSCTAVEYRKESNETVQRYLERKGDDAEELLKGVYKYMKRDSNFLIDGFIDHVFQDLTKAAVIYEYDTNEVRFKHLNSTLPRKYNWRSWLIIAYGGLSTHEGVQFSTYPFAADELGYEKKGDCDGYFRNFVHFHRTNYVIGTPSNCTDEKWRAKAQKCIDDNIYQVRNCEKAKVIATCLYEQKMSYLVIGCVNDFHSFGHGIRNIAVGTRGNVVVYVLK